MKKIKKKKDLSLAEESGRESWEQEKKEQIAESVMDDLQEMISKWNSP